VTAAVDPERLGNARGGIDNVTVVLFRV